MAKLKYFAPRSDPRVHRKEQPALFDQTQIKPTDQHRYQRGFTPQRMRSVQRSMQSVETIGPPSLQAHFRESVARSTAPLTAFKSVEGVETSPHASVRHAGIGGTTRTTFDPESDSSPTSSIHIYHGSLYGQNSNLNRAASRREVFSGAVVHELGHAHEAHSDYWKMDFEGAGKNEAFADRFMVKHFRPDPREVRRGSSIDPRDQTYPAMGVEVQGYPKYDQMLRESFTRTARQQPRVRPQSEQPQLDEHLPVQQVVENGRVKLRKPGALG